MKRHAVGGSSLNPGAYGHLALLQSMVDSGLFDYVHWIPSGIRADKSGFVDPNLRLNMAKILKSKVVLPPKVEIILHDEDVMGANTPSILWLEKLQGEYPDDKFFWYTGSDSLIPKYDGLCEIEAKWFRGSELCAKWPIVCLPRADYPLPNQSEFKNRAFYDRFKNLIFLSLMLSGVSSTEIRKLISLGQPFEHLTLPEIAEIIKEHGLYGYTPKEGKK